MPNLTVETVRSGGVSLVELLLEANRHCRVHLEVIFDGPIWTPGIANHSTTTWDDGAVAVELDAETTLPIGFATPVEVTSSAVEIVEVEQLSAALPAEIASWLERVEKRIVVAERLSAVTPSKRRRTKSLRWAVWRRSRRWRQKFRETVGWRWRSRSYRRNYVSDSKRSTSRFRRSLSSLTRAGPDTFS